jgi:hypothetical protein
MSDTHLRLLRRVAVLRRRGVRGRATTAPADTSGRVEELADASARADAQVIAATKRRHRRAVTPASSPAEP